MKRYEEMSDHEILMELIREKRRNDRLRYVRYGVYALILIGIAILGSVYIPKIVKFINRYNAIMDQLESTSNTIKDLTGKISTDTLDEISKMVETIKNMLSKFGLR